MAVTELENLLPALVLDLRYANEDDDKDALRARVNGVQASLAQIGEVPP